MNKRQKYLERQIKKLKLTKQEEEELRKALALPANRPLWKRLLGLK